MELSGKSNINPKIWGPFFWKTFHLSTFGYPKSPNELDIETYKNFYKSFMKILPCDKCSIESQKILNVSDDELTKALESGDALVNWGYSFHKAVNDKSSVESIELSVFKKNMADLISGKIKTQVENNNSSYKMYLFIFIFIIIIIGVSYFGFKHYMQDIPQI
jgi:hypothetical protein